MESPAAWAHREFGEVQLGDVRRTRRAVRMAQAMAEAPGATVGGQMAGWVAQKAAYRLLDNATVSRAALSQPHWEATRAASGREAVVVLASDITALDYTQHPAVSDLGPIGNHGGQGLQVHSTLSVRPNDGWVLGLAYQQVWTRPPGISRAQESRAARVKRTDRQSQVWLQAVAALGTPPQGSRWVHVADRESDIFEFMTTVTGVGAQFCVRACQNRRLAGKASAYLFETIRACAPQGQRELRLATGETVRLQVSWAALEIAPPAYLRGSAPLPVGVVRTWEAAPSANRPAIEWILLTNVPVNTMREAEERLRWYTCRWRIEEYHRCLKSGCRVEQSQLESAARLQRLLAFLAILAVRLLQLRLLVNTEPQRPALQIVEPLLVQIVAADLQTPPAALTLQQFWIRIAIWGGFPNRKSDGDPGWVRLWRGWLKLLTLADGVRLAQQLPPLQDVGNP
jgi:hypothetical protein